MRDTKEDETRTGWKTTRLQQTDANPSWGGLVMKQHMHSQGVRWSSFVAAEVAPVCGLSVLEQRDDLSDTSDSPSVMSAEVQ